MIIKFFDVNFKYTIYHLAIFNPVKSKLNFSSNTLLPIRIIIIIIETESFNELPLSFISNKLDKRFTCINILHIFTNQRVLTIL